MNPAKFRLLVLKHYRSFGRHYLPWRNTRDPYRILVSEVMLQQTQVERVIPYYQAWMQEFPTVRKLASAPLSAVLKRWQGLGYNRRAKALHEAAKILVTQGFPKTAGELEKLPGIGPYTARAVMTFAHNADELFVETNIRTAVLHHFFPHKKQVSDKEILVILKQAHPRGKGREWYAALMDYGAHLKREGVRLNANAKGYAKQSAFKGSDREARGAILKRLAQGRTTHATLQALLGDDRIDQVKTQLTNLTNEGMIRKVGRSYELPA